MALSTKGRGALPLLVITGENQPHVSPCWRHATKPHRWVLLSLSWAASLVFFATWAIVAVAGTVSIDAKRRRLLGTAWEPFAAQTSIVPFAAIAAGRNRLIPREVGVWRWAIALLAYVLMLGGHGPVLGVSPFPL